jgi:hypothetical protein
LPPGWTFTAPGNGTLSATTTSGMNLSGMNFGNAIVSGSPTAVDHLYELSRNATSSATSGNGVLVDAADPALLPLSAQLVVGPTHGTLRLRADGSFDYTPGSGFAGVDQFTYRVSDGNDSSPTATVTLISPEGAIVRKLYEQVLNREPDLHGLKYWTDKVINQHLTYGRISVGFFESDEHLTPIIQDYYSTYLSRIADASGLSYWKGVWRQTGGPETVQVGIIGSGEFFRIIANGSNSLWVTELYRRLLNREPDPGGLQHWTALLDQGVSEKTIVLHFVTAKEYRRNLVTAWFDEYLSTAPTDDQLSTDVQWMAAGASDRDVQVDIINMPAYALIPPQPSPGSVNRLTPGLKPTIAESADATLAAHDAAFASLG